MAEIEEISDDLDLISKLRLKIIRRFSKDNELDMNDKFESWFIRKFGIKKGHIMLERDTRGYGKGYVEEQTDAIWLGFNVGYFQRKYDDRIKQNDLDS